MVSLRDLSFRAPNARALPRCPFGGAFTVTKAIRWDSAQDGLQTRLILLDKRYILGERKNVRLELTNASDTTKQYDAQGADINGSLLIIGPDGIPVPYTAGSYQTGGSLKPLHPGETAVLIAAMDIWSQYFIHEPGRHEVRFRGLGTFFGDCPIPPSNIVILDVLPSGLGNHLEQRIRTPPQDRPERMGAVDVAPRERSRSRSHSPGKSPGEGNPFSLATLIPEGFVDKGDHIQSSIRLADLVVDKSRKAVWNACEYFGRSPWGQGACSPSRES